MPRANKVVLSDMEQQARLEQQRAKDRARKAKSRAAMSDAKRNQERAKARAAMAKRRGNMSEEQRDAVRARSREEMRRKRSNMTEEQRKEVRDRERVRQQVRRRQIREDQEAKRRAKRQRRADNNNVQAVEPPMDEVDFAILEELSDMGDMPPLLDVTNVPSRVEVRVENLDDINLDFMEELLGMDGTPSLEMVV